MIITILVYALQGIYVNKKAYLRLNFSTSKIPLPRTRKDNNLKYPCKKTQKIKLKFPSYRLLLVFSPQTEFLILFLLASHF
jgi:hypothetical protein